MHRTSKYLALALVLIVSAVILVFAVRKSRRYTAGFNVQLATNTCSCYPDSPPILVLHISSRGRLVLNSEAVPDSQLADRLREIYGTRAERVLYLFPENNTPFQRFANVIDVVQHLRAGKLSELPVPRELQVKPENLNIQIRLVTTGALSAPCPKDCFNWATQDLPVVPRASSGKVGRAIQPSAPD